MILSRYFAVLTLVVLLVVVPATRASSDETQPAADPKDAPLDFGALLGVGAGVLVMDVSGINDALSGLNLSDFQDTSPLYTIELHGIALRRVVFGTTGALTQQRRSAGGVNADWTSGFLTADVGVIVFDNAGFRGYPVLGLGWGAAALNTSGLGKDQSNNQRVGMMNVDVGDRQYGAVIGRLAFNLDYSIPLTSSDMYTAFVFTGLRLGAMGEIASNGWSSDRSGVTGNPDFAFQGAYATLVFGIGGGMSESMMEGMHGMHGMHQMHHGDDQDSK